MYALGSRRDMGTLVAPIGSAAVAMPAASRRTTCAVRWVKLNIVAHDVDDDDG